MYIIDEMQAAIWRKAVISKEPLPPSLLDPVGFVADGECVSTLGMGIPMWDCIYERSVEDICGCSIAI